MDNLGLITKGNTYRRYTASALPLWGNTDVVQANITLVYVLLRKGPIWIQKFNAMVRFILNTFLIVADACEGVNHKYEVCSSKNITQAPVHPHIKLLK